MGVSHQPLVDVRGHRYDRPVAAMEAYLDAYEQVPYLAAPPAEDPPVVLSALGPRMLRLAAERTDGAHPYFVPVEHTSIAREVMGEGPVLAPEQTVVVTEDPVEARAVARRFMATYLRLPNYRNSLKRLGWTDEELDEVPDRLVDAVVAWGSPDRIAERVVDHMARGADHVAVQCIDREQGTFPLDDHLRLAPVLREAVDG
jgi:probable F420-dependent oxidoreductase